MFQMNQERLTKLNWISDTVIISLLWGLFLILGAGVFTVFPATYTVMILVRQRMVHKESWIGLREFWKYLKKNFFKVNCYGIVMVFILKCGILYLRMSQNIDNYLEPLFVWFAYFLIVFCLFWQYYTVVLMTQLSYSWRKLSYYSLIMIISCPIHSILLLGVLLLCLETLSIVWWILPFGGIAIIIEISERIIFHAQKVIIDRQNRM